MVTMRSLPSAAAPLVLGALVGAILAGCGSQTKTVTAASTPPATQTTGTTHTPSTSSTSTTQTSTTSTTTSTPSTTRTASEPAFTEQSGHGEGVSAAAATVRSKGYTPNDTSEYHSGQTLRVLIGTRTGSGDGYGQQAFFFVDGRYIGTDAKEPSAKLKVVSQGDTEVAIAYPLYRKNDPLCCPGGGQKVVHFQLDNGRLTALDTIPPVRSGQGLSRY